MDQITLAAISGRGSSFFSRKMGDMWHEGSPFLGQGDPGLSLYNQAVAEVAQWDSLVQRVASIANQTVRNQIATDFGINDPGNTDKGQYMRNKTAEDIGIAQSYTPINYRIYVGPGPTKNRPGQLNNFLSDLRHQVEAAETTYGSLPAPVTITQLVNGPGLPDWVLPVGVGVGGLALLGAFGIIKF